MNKKYDDHKMETVNPTFEGILYEKYGIGRGMAFEEAVSILEQNGFTFKKIDKDLYVAYSQNEILYGFPIEYMTFAKQTVTKSDNYDFYGELLSSVCIYISDEYEKQFSDFLYEQIYTKYNFLQEYSETTGLHIYAPQLERKETGYFNKSEKYLDYSRAITTDSFQNKSGNYIACYSFYHELMSFDPLYKALKEDWTRCLICDTDDEANIEFGEHNWDEEKNNFFRLLNKWNDILSREDADIDLEISYESNKTKINMSYNSALYFYFVKDIDYMYLHLWYEKDSKEISSRVRMDYRNSDRGSYQKEIKMCLESLIYHLEDLAPEESFDGVEFWNHYSELVEREEEKKKKDNDKFEDDFDNL